MEIDKILDECKNKLDYSTKLLDAESYIKSMIDVRNPSFQRNFRESLIKEFGCTCALCSINVKDLLVASHIVGYAKCVSNKERIDRNNGILLCKNHDGLFDRGYMSFDEDGKIILPKRELISLDVLMDLNINENNHLANQYINEERKKYFSRHAKENKRKLRK